MLGKSHEHGTRGVLQTNASPRPILDLCPWGPQRAFFVESVHFFSMYITSLGLAVARPSIKEIDKTCMTSAPWVSGVTSTCHSP